MEKYRVHKRNHRAEQPDVSIILLDWSCREHFQALDWLPIQTVARERYELIWVELFDRVVPRVLDDCDVVITCGQKGMYHKHEGYNAGLLEARGRIITVCDSDAIFPSEFIESILQSFNAPEPLVLMHYEWRSDTEYPGRLARFDEVSQYRWKDLWPNVGACVSVRKVDAIRFGGFDEDESYRGFICGPYELAWRLVNAGLPEIWHDPKVALWHFAHPAPYFHPLEFSWANVRRSFEITRSHCEYHALSAVEGFSTGRLLPLQENPEIFRIRMSSRQIGSPFEERYAARTGPKGFTFLDRVKMRLSLFRESLVRFSGLIIRVADKVLGRERLKALYRLVRKA